MYAPGSQDNSLPVPNQAGTPTPFKPGGPTGGSATAAGIWYQALWCVLQATSARVAAANWVDDDVRDLRLVLEPFGGGGDVVVEQAGSRRVVQLKTLARGTWSLKDIVEDVLPDLYCDVDLNDAASVVYEFVTEGRLGDWTQVRQFFESLSRVEVVSSTSEFRRGYDRLDKKRLMKFGGARHAFWKGQTTERGLFDRIVGYLKADGPATNEPVETVQRKTWRLLANLRFSFDKSEAAIRHELDSLLLAVVESREQLSQHRNSMVGELILRSRENNATFSPKDLLKSQGFEYVIPLTEWAVLKDRCRRQTQRRIEQAGYEPAWDVRSTQHNCLGPLSTPFTIITGESGVGKSWYLFATANSVNASAIVLLNATNEAKDDLRQAGDRVWQTALGHDDSRNLEVISRRLADIRKHTIDEPWLTVCIDRVDDLGEARDLWEEPLEDWRVNLVLACAPHVAAWFKERQKSSTRVTIIRVDRFTSVERDNYLERRLGPTWAAIPSDVRELLRTPQLAHVYSEMAEELGGWQPRTEYALIERYWQRMTSGLNAGHPHDESRLAALAGTVIDGGAYPWDVRTLDKNEVDNATITRLTDAGWLRRTPTRHFEFSHERLLNFAVAMEQMFRHRDGQVGDSELAKWLAQRLRETDRVAGPRLGYVPMDWFYLRSKEDSAATSRVLGLLEKELSFQEREGLHVHLLPTLGKASIPLLQDQLIALSEAANWWELEHVVKGLAIRPTGENEDLILKLLSDKRPRVCRAALKVLALHPTLQFEAQRVLAAHGDHKAVIESVIHVGAFPADLDEWADLPITAGLDTREHVRAVVHDRQDGELRGALMALGLMGDASCLADMISILEGFATDDAKRAALVGIEHLGEVGAPATDSVAACLSAKSLRHCAIRALERIHTPAARLKLAESLKNQWDVSLATWLAQFPETQLMAEDGLVKALDVDDLRQSTSWQSPMGDLLGEATDGVLERVLKRLPKLENLVREVGFASEGSFWIVGSKFNAIRGLILYNPKAASLALSQSLSDPSAHDRHLYPSVYYRLNSTAARDLFLKLAASETDQAVLWTMSYVLSVDDQPWLVDQLSSSDAGVRCAACRLINVERVNDDTQTRLRALLEDTDDGVVRVAEESLTRICKQSWATELAVALESVDENDTLRAWRFVDAAVVVGEVGYPNTPWPAWAKQIIDSRIVNKFPAMRAKFVSQLNEKRKNADDEAKRKANR